MVVEADTLFEQATDPMVEVRFDGETPIIAAVNSSFETIFDCSADEVRGRSLTDVLVPDAGHEQHVSLRRSVSEGESIDRIIRRETKNGVRQFELRVIPFEESDGSRGAYGWYIDVTDQKNYEERLESLNEASGALMTATSVSEVADVTVEIAREVLDQSLTAMWSYDSEADVLRPVTATEEATAFDASRPGSTGPGPIEPETREMEIFKRGEITIIEDYAAVDNPSDPETPLGTVLIAPLGEHGQLHVGLQATNEFDPGTRDLIEILAQNAEAALDRVHRERRLSDLNEITSELVKTTETAEITTLATEAGSDILGLPYTHVYLVSSDGETMEPAAATDETTDKFGELPTFERGEGLLWEVLESGETRLYDDVQTEAALRSDLSFRGAVIAPLGENGVFASGTLEPAEFDSFDRKVVSILAATTAAALDRAERERRLRVHEEELKAARDRFQSVFEHSNDAIVIFDPDTDEILEGNPRACDLLGYSREELLSIGPSDIHPEEMEAFRTFLDTVKRESSGRTDRLACRRKDGEHVPAEVSASTMEFEGREAVLALIRDVSELRAYERELERQNDRLEEFAGLISHDLRNPLSVAMGRIDLAREEHASDHLETTRSALERMEEIIEDVLTLTRMGDANLTMQSVALDSVVDTCWQNVETTGADISISTAVEIRADESRLRNVFENLMRNAIEHAESEVTVRIGELPDSEGFYVEDTGPGIPPDERDQVFEHGYSTSAEGTGFGLSIVLEIVHAHGWEISVTESEEGGARFEVTGVDVVT